MADRRSKVMNKQVGPWALPGMVFLADTVTLTATKVLTLTFPAKTVIAVLTSSTADTDAELIAWASSVTDEVATVTFTATSAGATNKFSYLVIATEVETIGANTLTVDTGETPVA
jgi:hypothetical protein